MFARYVYRVIFVIGLIIDGLEISTFIKQKAQQAGTTAHFKKEGGWVLLEELLIGTR